jgi:DNA-binding LacI/PurR family transcriptional regulator
MQKSTRKSVTLRDVAALAGIDKATASRALSGKGYMSQQTREAALKAAKELGFQPDLHAQNLAHGRSKNIIGMFPSNDLGVSTQQAWFVEHRLDELGFEVQIHNTPRWVNHYEGRQANLVNKVRRQRPGAIIFESFLASEALNELRLFVEEGGIVVGYGSEVDLLCDQVLFAVEHRAYLAARHLLELGHLDIGFCSHGPIDLESTELMGFIRALKEYGVQPQEKWIFKGGKYEEGGARLAEAFLAWSEKPTALCIVNDVSASTFVTTLARHGFNVPRDVSVVGFDDAPAARYALTPLTSANYPLEVIGRRIVEFTHSRLQGYTGPPRQEIVHSELVVRSSTAPLVKRRNRSKSLRSHIEPLQRSAVLTS